MNNEIAIVLPAALTEPQQAAWLGMAKQKNEVVAKLATYKLQLQGILLKIKDSTLHADIDAGLAEYRKVLSEMVEYRKAFTNKVNAGIIEPLMLPEKELAVTVNADYLAVIAASLELRQAEAAKAAKANARIAEITAFKLHIDTDNERRVLVYHTMLQKEITHQYALHLKSGVKEGWDLVKSEMKKLEIPLAEKFTGNILTTEEMKDIFSQSKKVNFAAKYEEMMERFDTTFANFDSDILQAEKAIEAQEVEAAASTLQAKEDFKKTLAVSALLAKADTVQIDSPKIKTTVEVIIVQSTKWRNAVMTNFLFHQPPVAVKKMEALTVGQMATALGKLASDSTSKIDFKGLELKEFVK